MAGNREGRIDVGASWRSLSRRWPIVVGFLAVGLVGGIAYRLISPREMVAHSLVLLSPAPADGTRGPARDMETETRIASSSPVLRMAITATGGSVSIADLRQRVEASGVTPSLLEVRVADSSTVQAVALANAVARGYVTYSKELVSRSGASVAQSLSQRAADLTSQLDDVDTQIADQTAKLAGLAVGSPAAATAGAELYALQTRLTSLTEDLSGVNDAINEASLEAAGRTNGLRVLERATGASGPSLFATVLPILASALLAIVLGCGIALWWDRRDGRARRPTDIAAAIGAPVLASMRAPVSSDPASASDGSSRTTDGHEQTLRHLQRRLRGTGQRDGFLAVSFSGDDAVMPVIEQLSEAAAQSGLQTALFAPSCRSFTGPVMHGTNLGGAVRDNLTAYALHDGMEGDATSADLAIVLIVTDGATLELPRWSASLPAVMSVSAGFASRAELASVSAMMRAAGRPFSGAIVIDPDPRDDSSTWSTEFGEVRLHPTRVTGMGEEAIS